MPDRLHHLGFAFRLAWRQSRAGWRELSALVLALTIGVSALVAVSAFTHRVGQALNDNAAAIIGGDLSIRWDHPLPAGFYDQARNLGLRLAQSAGFPSMVIHGDRNVLVETKAVSTGFPLRGALTVQGTQGRLLSGIPRPGTVWVQPDLLPRLDLRLGDALQLGQREFRIAGIILKEPSRAGSAFSLGPRVMLNSRDLPGTGLIQFGSRVTYRLYVRGNAGQVAAFERWARARLALGMQIQDLQNARPELRLNLQRAKRFLGLSALTALLLAGVAIGLSVRSFVARRLDAVAVLRCLGASMGTIMAIYLGQILMLALFGIALGILLGYAAQVILPPLMGDVLPAALPAPSFQAGLIGILTGMLTIFVFALPPLLRLRQVPALRVLRRDLELKQGFDPVNGAIYALSALLFAGLFIWQANDLRLGLYVLVGSVATAVLLSAAAWLLLRAFSRLRAWGGIGWRFGLANLARPGNHSLSQILAFGIALLALLSISVVQGDLLKAWQEQIPAQAPNRFIINIQPGQGHAIDAVFREEGMVPPKLYPIVHARLVAIDGRPTASIRFKNVQDKTLATREFNLSWTRRPQVDNRIIAGRWWNNADYGKPFLSVEEGIARILGVGPGSRMTYEVAGQRFTATVLNLRKVNWDTFNVNFFVVTPPGFLAGLPVNYVTSFHLPPDKPRLLTRLLTRLPNLTVIDVGAILAQVRSMLQQVRQVVGFVFLFTVAAGFVVLLAALQATRAQREQDTAVLRALGASSEQMRQAALAEFAVIGVIAGSIAALAASVLSAWLSIKLFQLPYHLNPWLWFWGPLLGAVGIGLSGMLGLRRVLKTPPLQVLR